MIIRKVMWEREAYCGLQLEEGGERETTSVSDRRRSFVRSGFELVVEGLAYFRLTRIRNRPFRLEKGASEMAQSLFGERGVVHFGCSTDCSRSHRSMLQ